jgi:DNA-binding GntR family transcriptional regulator
LAHVNRNQIKRLPARKGRPPKSKAAQVYAQLKEALLLAKFRAGEVLSIRVLADALGTSTMPVREAITRLITERALEPLPRRGVRVPILTASQERDIYRVRYVLEGMASELAAAAITDQEIGQLESYEAKLKSAIERQAIAEAHCANVQFHLTLYRASGAEILIELIEAIYLRYAPSLYTVLDRLPVGNERRAAFVHTHHLAILDAARRRDPAGVRQALERDLSDAVGFNHLLPR